MFGRNYSLYTQEEVAALKKHFTKTISEFKKAKLKQYNLLTTVDVAKALDLSPETLYSLIRRGRVQKPTHDISSVSRHKKYSEEDVKELKKQLKNYRSKKSATRRREELTRSGFYSGHEAAKALGVPHVTLMSWQKNGSIEKPTTKPEGEPHCYYTDEDLKAIKTRKAKYFSKRITR